MRSRVSNAIARALNVCAIACALISVSNAVSAQTNTGGIRGLVKDDTGAVLAGVTIETTSNVLVGGASVQVTNERGEYRYERLPIGVYKFVFSLQGFQSIIRDGVRVELGRTIDLDVTMGVSALEENVTVSAAAPVVDSVHAGTSTNFTQAMLEEIPSARTSWFNTIAFAPAVRADVENFSSSNFLMYGSNANQNSFQFEGIDYNSPMSGGLYMRPNPDATGELQIKSIGATAEEAGFQGGIINEILRSATNQWKGHVAYYYMGNSLVGNNTPDAQYPFAIAYLSDLTASIGGPVVKDRIFANLMFERFDNKQVQVGVPIDNGPIAKRTKPALKVNARISQSNSIDFAYTDSYHDAAPQASILQPVETFNEDAAHDPVFAGTWSKVFGSRTVFEMKGGGIWFPTDPRPPRSNDTTTPGRFDIGTGQYSVNARTGNTNRFMNARITAALAHVTDKFIRGTHDLKVGTQITPASGGFEAMAMVGGEYFTDRNGQPFRVERQEPAVRAGVMRGIGVYFQDNWQISNRATLNLGIRVDRTTGSVAEADQYDAASRKTGVTFSEVPDVIKFTDVSPRLGMTYKVDSDGHTVAKASYGRYFGRMQVSQFSALSPGNLPTVTYNYNPLTGLYDIFQSSVDPKANYAVDPDLTNEYTDQFYLGVERQLAPGLGVDATFVVKKEHNWIRVEDKTGVYVPIQVADTFQGKTQVLTIYDRVSPSSQSLFTTTNRNDFRQDYKSMVVQVNKRMTDTWQLLGAYQWERSYGVNTGALALNSQNFGDTGPNGFGRDPNDLINAYGPQYTNSEHTLRATGNVRVPGAINIGAQASFETGRQYGRVITVANLGQGTRVIQAEPRGTYHLPSTSNLQVRVGRDFTLSGGHRLRLSLDLYNIFNVDTAISVRNDSTQRPELFGQTLAVVSPRRAQIGFRYEF